MIILSQENKGFKKEREKERERRCHCEDGNDYKIFIQCLHILKMLF